MTRGNTAPMAIQWRAYSRTMSRTAARRTREREAFTLIELLIVVAIISILASIAVPNFLEAQTRAKVSRVKNDARTLATGLESYRVDNNDYPYREKYPPGDMFAGLGNASTRARDLSKITTPIAYLTTLPKDIFEKRLAPPNDLLEYWSDYILGPSNLDPFRLPGWGILSVGPDGHMGQFGNWGGPEQPEPPPDEENDYLLDYDPTNGTISGGNVYRFQSGEPASRVFFGP